MIASKINGIALEVGVLTPGMHPKNDLSEGEVGYIVTNLKTTREAKVGDTVTLTKKPAATPLPGYKRRLKNSPSVTLPSVLNQKIARS